jgi:hypothetical protein
MAGYLWAGLILPVSVGAAAHSLILSALKFLAPQQAIVRILTFASAPVLPFVSATTGWEHYTEGVPIPIAVATLAYGLACAFGPQVVARLLAAPPVTQSNSSRVESCSDGNSLEGRATCAYGNGAARAH